ncbi:MAG: chromosome segregation protein SMC [Thermoanaerobaculia bacterium]|nr:chromosome segregation protein SMC [Thermoanaerobaculia bacterium]
MLKLQRLELSGFKSFVDPAVVSFSGGVTGIVGPNGCGKSNLSEALTWVLGEQSAKSLRGDTMEDVIFNGTEQRHPLGMAEVAVTFECDPSFERAEEGELTISRRVFRSGESQYRINGRVVRLKDVKDLLMDTGLGIRAYSVIEQGRIGMILSGKPQERRRLIEEAAGITRYKARKHLAELKLQEATGNLMRLDDILAEVDRNLRVLKRQASAARRYEERRTEHRARLRQLLLGRHAELAGALAGRRRELDEAIAAEAASSAGIHRSEADLAARREEVEGQAAQLAEAARQQAALVGTIEGRQEFLRGALRTGEDLRARTRAGAEQTGRREGDLANRRRRLGELAGQRAELADLVSRAAAAVADEEQALATAQQAAALAERRLESLRQELLGSLGGLDTLRSRSHREQIEVEKADLRLRHLADERGVRERELAEAEAESRRAAERLAALEERAARGETALSRAEASVAEALALEAAVTERLRAHETDLAARRERQRFLGELAAAEAAGRQQLVERLHRAGVPDPTFLGDRLRARRRGWERSLDLYLGELVDAVLLAPEADPLAVAEALAAAGDGGAVLLQPLAPGAPAATPPDDPAVLGPLAEAVGLPAEIAACLPPAFLVASREAAVDLARRHPGTAFLTRDRLWASAGLLRLLGDGAQPGLLARTSELADLEELLARLEAERTAAQEELAARLAARSEAARRLGQERDDLATVRQELAVARARKEESASRVRRAESGLAAVAAESGELAEARQRIAERQRLLALEIAEASAAHAAREAAFDAAQREVAEAREARESRRTTGAGRRGQLEVLGERLRSLDFEVSRLEEESRGLETQAAAWAREAEEIEARLAALAAASTEAERELAAAMARQEEEGEALRRGQEELEAARAELRLREQELAALRERRDVERTAVETGRVELVGLEHDLAHLGGSFQEEFRAPLPEIPGEVPPNLAELQAEVDRLRALLEGMGPVNVLAAEEYAEQEERQRFLSVQRTDVASSMESLRQTIREINETSIARFQQAFAEVNRHFGETFVELFRGGEAEMRLMDEEDLLESGIEIVARPPGKRLQNLMLLSGGEKALTAIALLFALFRTKPSPLCILDEVDAPLDDVNTLRFVGMLRQLAKETQCIVVTHNKLTMEIAGTLYGVTMEERGVSKLVAVRLDDVQPEAPAAATA